MFPWVTISKDISLKKQGPKIKTLVMYVKESFPNR